MKIEIGKEYMISPKYKKSFVQNEVYENNNGDKVIIESVFRNGQYIVKVNSKAEKKLLEEYMNEVESDMGPDEFEENEFVSCHDECWRDIYIHSSNVEQDENEIIDSVKEEGYEWLEENGYEAITMEHYLGLPLEVEEVDPNNRYGL
jgi:hypothetical protein